MLLTPDEHAHLHCMPIDNHCFACQQPSIAVLASDVEALEGSDVPIILPREPNALPLALLYASQQEDPLNGRTPALWENMPFSLSSPVVGLNNEGKANSRVVLQAEPNAPHWSPDTGHRLFTAEGQPTAFLTRVLERLQQQKAMTQRTQDMIDLLHETGSLTPATVFCQGQAFAVHQIDMEKLKKGLDTTNSSFGLLVYRFAHLLHQSHADLKKIQAYRRPVAAWTEKRRSSDIT